MKLTHVVAFCAALAPPVAALAQGEIDYATYGTARGWQVFAFSSAGTFGFCDAIREADGLSLGLGPDGWTLAVPFPEEGLVGAGQVTVGATTARVTWSTGEGYARTVAPVEIMGVIAAGSEMTTRFGNAPPESWSLAGTAAAMGKVSECWGTAGGTIGMATVPHAEDMSGEETSELDYRPFTTTPGWTVDAVFAAEYFGRCEASSDHGVTLGYSADGWDVAVPMPEWGAPTPGILGVDKADQQVTWALTDYRATTMVTQDWMGLIAQGRQMTTQIGQAPAEYWELAGAREALNKVVDCWNAGGVAPGTAAVPVPPQPAEDDASRLGTGCPAWGTVQSPASNTPSRVTFVNGVDHAVSVYWIGFDGTLTEYAGLLPGETYVVDSYAGHMWLAKDFDATCFGGVLMVPTGGGTIAIR